MDTPCISSMTKKNYSLHILAKNSGCRWMWNQREDIGSLPLHAIMLPGHGCQLLSYIRLKEESFQLLEQLSETSNKGFQEFTIFLSFTGLSGEI
jgi:hypothetical protein